MLPNVSVTLAAGGWVAQFANCNCEGAVGQLLGSVLSLSSSHNNNNSSLNRCHCRSNKCHLTIKFKILMWKTCPCNIANKIGKYKAPNYAKPLIEVYSEIQMIFSWLQPMQQQRTVGTYDKLCVIFVFGQIFRYWN